MLRWPACGQPGRRAASFRGTPNPGGGGGLPRLGLPSGARVKEEELLLYFGAIPNRERDFFYLNPCTVEEMVFLVGRPGGRGALGWNFSGAAGRGAALIFRMVVGIRGSAFLFWCGFYTGGKKCSVGTGLKMFHMFISYLYLCFFSWYLYLALIHTLTDRSPSPYLTI